MLNAWAKRWGVSGAAVSDLVDVLTNAPENTSYAEGSEGLAQSLVRLEASRAGCKLFRNNVGVLIDKRGVPVRYGLANDSKQLNATIKSADLIGWRPIVITPAHVGRKFAQFLSRECKHPGWTFTGNAHEIAQLKWAELINNDGGDASFSTGEGSI